MFWTTKKESSRSSPIAASKTPLAISLEPRMLFDGAVVATVADAAADTPPAPDGTQAHSTSEISDNPMPLAATADQRQEVVFIDGKVSDKQLLIDGIKPGVEIVILDSNKDGLQQIADYLQNREGIDAIHILSHGDTGRILLGDTWLDKNGIENRSELLAALGSALSENGDILLYGCNVGADGSGTEFIQAFAAATSADIAASNDLTGHSALQGNWVLEVSTGSVEASPAVLAAATDNYLYTLEPVDQDFETPPAGAPYSFTGSQTIDGVTYTLVSPAGGFSTITATDDFSITPQDPGKLYGYDLALVFNLDQANTGISGPLDARISSADGNEFKLVSMEIDTGTNMGTSPNLTIKGYLNGVEVASDTVNTSASDSTGSITYTKNAVPGGSGGTLTFSSAWQYIDEFRITGNDTIVAVDDLNFAPAVLPNAAPTISNLNGDSVAWAGAGNTVTLDAGMNATFSDTEFGALNGGNGDWAGATLMVQQASGAVPSDVFGLNTLGASFTVSGNTLRSDGLTFATFTSSGGVLTITFTSTGTAATTALVNDVARHVTYRSDTPAGDATIRFSMTDGTSTATANTTVTSDTIYVTNATDTATIDRTNGVSFSEAIAIAAADATGSQTIVFASNLAGQTLNLNTASINESLTFDMTQANGLTLTGGTITLAGGTTQVFNVSSGYSATISSLIAGTGALTKAGAGELTLAGAGNTYSGATSISAGTLTVSGGDALSTSTSVSVAAGATLALAGNEAFGNLSGAGSVNLGSFNLTSTQTADTTFSGTLSGSGGVTFNQTVAATYATTLSGTNTYTGATVLANYGWLKLDGDASMSNSSAVRVNGNGTLTLLSDQTIGSLASGGPSAKIQLGSYTLTAGGDNTTTSVLGGMSGTGSLVKLGSGTMALFGNNTYNGTTSVSAGALSIVSDSNLGGGAVSLAGGTALNVSGATTIDNAIILTGDSSIGNSNAVNFSGAISGAYDLTKTGSGTLTLSGNNSYGATFVNAGTLSIANDGNLGSGAVNLAAGTTLALTGASIIDNAIVLGGDATVTAAANATLSGLVSGAYALTKAGAANLTLDGSNTYGATTVSAGTLSVASDGNLGSGTLTLGAGTTLAVTSAATLDNNIALSGSATVNTGANTTLSGVISGGNNLTKTGAGTLTLTGNNTYSGSTSVNTGTLSIASDSNLGTGPLNLANGTILQITGNTTLDNALALTGLVTVNAGAAATLSGTISGTGSLIKAGASNLTLSGSNTNSGTTTVSAGTLVVDGSTASATTVASGATLAGSGTLGGDVTVQSGGTLSPGGVGVATLTVNGNLTLASGSTLALDINGATAGTGYDRVVVNGTVDVSGAALAVSHGYAAGSGDSYTVIVNDAADAVTGTFSGVSEGGKFNAADNATELTTSYIGGSGNDLTLTAPIAPTVTSVSSSTANGTYKIGDVITVTVRFDSAVNVTGTPTLTLETGATDRVLNYLSGSGTDTLSFSYTVQAGDSSADLDYTSTSALSLNGGTITDGANQNAILTLAAPGAAGSLGANKALVVDGVRPAATSITLSDSNLRIGETATVTVTFNERVSGLDTADFSVANGTLSGLSSSDGGLTWTATFTPSASISNATNLITLDNTGVMDQAGNIGSGTTDSVNYAIDTQRPTATIVVTDSVLKAGQTTTVTITFSEAVTGLGIGDFLVENGTLSGLSSNDGGITWTATLTPSANVTDTTNLITLDNTGYTDVAGNAGTGSTDSDNYVIDTQLPTATIVVADTALKAGQSTTVTITFSEAVTELTTADFSVANGSLSGLSSNDGGITWTATLTPGANVTDSTNVITLNNAGYTDLAGNAGTGSTDSNNYAIDSQRPTASIAVGNTSLSIGDSTTVTITFSEAVTGLTIADFTVANGALSNLSSNDGGVTWTATLTPSADVASPTNQITLANTGYTDTAGNTGSTPTDSNNYSVDTQRPTATIVVNDTILAAGETTTVTITFNEAVSGLALANFAIANGVLSNLSTSDNITWTATLTPNANTSDATNLITLNNSGVQDQAGNTGVGTTDSNNYAIDTQRPTATSVLVTDTALKAGQSATVTITFSEAVSGLTTTDFSVANGMLSNLSSSDGGLTWTATLTPDANVTDATNLITLDNTGYADAAGNTGTGITTSNNYTIDTQRPTATIMVNDTALAVGETTAVTITFNEAVTGLSLADFSVANGTLSNLSTSDNITYTAILTPNGNIADSSNVITLNNTGVQDAAGNTGSGSTNSNNYAIDTQRPTATIQLSDTALAAGDTAIVTITFNEAVTGLSLADLSASNGTLSGLSSSDGGITWTAILTPAANVTASSNLITLNNTGVQDAAGNTGIGGTLSGNYAVDTVVPVIGSVSVPVGVQYNAGDTLTFVVNASEAVLVNGTPRLTLDIGGTTVFANYIAGSGTTTLVFQYSVQPGLNDADGITVTGLQSNGGSLRDATGNAMNLTLNNVGDTSGVRIDTTAPTATLALDQAASSAGNVRYTLTFSEDVSGVDLSDFSLVSTGNVQGTLSGLVQIDARTYQITISNVVGSGSLALALNSSGTGISDSAGNALIGGLVGQPYTQNQTEGDPEFRANPTPNVPTTPTAPPQPNVPGAPPSSTTSPLLPPPLFEQPTLGSGVPTLGNIFINNGALAPSYIAQVFASSDSGVGNGSGMGFLGFGGGDGGVFGTSSFSSMFNKDVPLESGEIQLRWGNSSGNGLGGGEILGAPTLSQQLQEVGESEQRQIRDLAWALGEIPLQMPQA